MPSAATSMETAATASMEATAATETSTPAEASAAEAAATADASAAAEAAATETSGTAQSADSASADAVRVPGKPCLLKHPIGRQAQRLRQPFWHIHRLEIDLPCDSLPERAAIGPDGSFQSNLVQHRRVEAAR